jgi:hypothetical protein
VIFGGFGAVSCGFSLVALISPVWGSLKGFEKFWGDLCESVGGFCARGVFW